MFRRLFRPIVNVNAVRKMTTGVAAVPVAPKWTPTTVDKELLALHREQVAELKNINSELEKLRAQKESHHSDLGVIAIGLAIPLSAIVCAIVTHD